MTARNLRFNPSTITVSREERVRFNVTSTDIFHTFTFMLNGREISLDLQPGIARSTDAFVFDESKEITFWCKPHRLLGMVGKIQVQ